MEKRLLNVKWTLRLAVVAAIVGVSAGCWLLLDGGPTGNLVLTVDSRMTPSSIVEPDLSMDIHEYQITISGPGATRSTTIGSGETVAAFTDLVPGTWTVVVSARNAGGIVIAADETSAVVQAGQTAVATVVVVPLAGDGTLELLISWPQGLFADPSVTATLTPVEGSGEAIGELFVVDTDSDPHTAAYEGSWAAGYYELAMQLRTGEDAVWSRVVAVRIIAGAASRGEYLLADTDLWLAGSLEVNIGADLNNPYRLTLSGVQETLFTGQEMTVEVSLDPPTASDSIRWFVNGEEQTSYTGATISFGPAYIELGVGQYHLDVLVREESMLSSQTASFAVVLEQQPGETPLSMVAVPGGSFQRDSTVTNVTTVSPFSMSTYEVTQAQYVAVTGKANPSHFASGADAPNRPVETVSWYDALVFCNMLSMAEGRTPVYTIDGSTNPADWGAVPTGGNDSTWDAAVMDMEANGYRLPTEAEWMWAAMGATSGHDYGGSGVYTTGYSKAFAGSTGTNSIGDYAWYRTNAYDVGEGHPDYGTHPVGTKLPNEPELYDMSGNVWEWTWDWWTSSYPAGDLADPTGPVSGTYRIHRGGGSSNSAPYCTVSDRFSYYPYYRYNFYGFRVVSR